jgi:phosphoglucosamine mutase
MFEYALVAGLTASGANAYLLHVTPTPSISYVVRSENFDCGIMVSASHNPYYDNGIKIINGYGYKLDGNIEEMIETYIDSEEDTLPFARRENIGRTVDYAIGRHRYIGYLISLATRSYQDKKVGLDLANGASTTVAKGVFDTVGAKTYVINSDPDGTNINRGCGSTHIEALQKFVVENNLDVGFAYDGDADRCLAIDEKGNIIDGDLILYICGVYMKNHNDLNNNTVVTTIMSNMGLYEALDKKGINYEKTAVGDKNVYENMMTNGHSIGGENSGHIIFSKHATTGDGILTSLKLMEVMLESKAKLSELHKDVTIFPQLLVNLKVKNKKAVKEDSVIKDLIASVSGEMGNEGRVMVRESGTEPVIRVMVEAKTQEMCKKYSDRVCQAIRDQGHTA